MIYELMLYFLVIPTLLRMELNVCGNGGGGIKSLKTENIAYRNYHKSTGYKTLYIFTVNVQVKCLISLLSPGLCYL